jgi:transcriptional regulator with XRE-family HTH domain
MAKLKLKELIASARSSVAYWTELAALDYTSALWVAMRRGDVSQVELANRIGKKPAYISRVLNGAPNITIRTMVEMALALGMRVQITLLEKEAVGATLYTSMAQNVDEAFVGHRLTRRETSRIELAAANENFAVVERVVTAGAAA